MPQPRSAMLARCNTWLVIWGLLGSVSVMLTTHMKKSLDSQPSSIFTRQLQQDSVPAVTDECDNLAELH
eukprot:SAG11_NODE_36906_length_259_cov_0.937500_1_plen_68_part_01